MADFKYIPYYRKKSKKGKSKFKKFVAVFLIVLVVLVSSGYLLLKSVSPVIVDTCTAKIKMLTTMAVNSAVYEVMTKPPKYTDLVTVEKDNSGKIQMIQANSALITQLAMDTAKQSESKVATFSEAGVSIPIGNLLGAAVFAGLGPDINIKLNPMGAVNCIFVSEFESMGINQTRHKIMLVVVTNMRIIIPSSSSEVTTTTQILICENIILGEVPEVYLNLSSLGGKTLDLTP